MPKENRNPPKNLVGPQGMTTLLTESNERFAHLEEKVNKLDKKFDELSDQVASTMGDLLVRLVDIFAAVTQEEETKTAETKSATKADPKKK